MDSLTFILAGTLAAATPLILAALGELVVEKSGVLNLSIEGMMATGAAVAFVVATLSGSAFFGFAAAAGAAVLLSLVFATLVLIFLANQVAAGLAVGILGLGLSALVGKRFEGTTIEPVARLDIPGLSDIALLGKVVFGQDLLVYLAIALIIVITRMLARTKLGLIIRAVGEAPNTAHAIGYPVLLVRYGCVAFGGALAGIAGAYITLSYTPLWAEGLIAGRGWIVVALVVFGTWRAGRIALGGYLFGAVSLLELSVQGFGLAIPSQILSASPYLITIIVLALISRDIRKTRLNSPASLGIPWRAGD
ncbi:MAG: ABC transporter permease [Gammaproteobacteria bacterium]|nr:ABC transporter permease [Gammaproteobacteria bacterium]